VRRLLFLIRDRGSARTCASGPRLRGGGPDHDSVRHEVFSFHDTNICGNEATWTVDVSSHTHFVVRDDGTFAYNFTQVNTYTLVFDDPTLGTWTARTTETIVHVSTGAGDDILHDNLSPAKAR
jgi:hypothetical protein